MQTGSAPSVVEVSLALAEGAFRAPESEALAQVPGKTFRSAARRHTFINSRWLLARAGQPVRSSVSHSALDTVVASTASDVSLGVDLERVRERDVLRLARFSFSEREAQELKLLAGAARLTHFYSLWVLKEACAKAAGRPLLEALSLFTFDRELRLSDPSLETYLFEPAPGLLVGLALEAVGAALHYERWPSGERSAWHLRARSPHSAMLAKAKNTCSTG